MNHKIRRLAALAISLLPSAGLRAALYRHLFRYRLGAGTVVGFGVVIVVDRFETGAGCVLGRGTSFLGPFSVEIGERTFIGRNNRFSCGAAAADPAHADMGYARRLVIGAEALVHEDHVFDVYGLIDIGARSWIAGNGSQFWTHGASVMDRDITIGHACYIGSAVRFAPGAGVADRTVVGIGAVVVRRFDETDVVIGGAPARCLKPRRPDDGLHFERDW